MVDGKSEAKKPRNWRMESVEVDGESLVGQSRVKGSGLGRTSQHLAGKLVPSAA